MIKSSDVGEGYRRLKPHEIIQEGDEWMRIRRIRDGGVSWTSNNAGVGHAVRSFHGSFTFRRRIN